MIAALILATQAKVLSLTPSDDIWVYPHASDQTSSEYLRAWGSDGQAIGELGDTQLAFSFSCLKFQLPADAPAGAPAKAVLIVTHAAPAGFTADESKQYPIEARLTSAAWEEESFTMANLKAVAPSPKAEAIFGTGIAKPTDDEKPFPVEINLLAKDSPFPTFLDFVRKSPSRELAVAITTRMDPQNAGEGGLYKFYSRSGPEAFRPKLVLEWASGEARTASAARSR